MEKAQNRSILLVFTYKKNYFTQEIQSVIKQGIKINILGDINKLNFQIKNSLKKSIKLTKKNNKIIVNLAINYGSKNEMITAMKKNKKN